MTDIEKLEKRVEQLEKLINNQQHFIGMLLDAISRNVGGIRDILNSRY